MINSVHALVYTPEPERMREFFSDVLELPHVDAGGGWLIFALPPAELAMHPVERGHEHHELTLMCDDIDATRTRLLERGVTFSGDITEQRWGRTLQIVLPDETQMMLYEPHHPVAAR